MDAQRKPEPLRRAKRRRIAQNRTCIGNANLPPLYQRTRQPGFWHAAEIRLCRRHHPFRPCRLCPDEEEEDPREKQESGREETRRRHQEEPRRRGRLDLSARPPHSAHAAHGAACAKPVPTAYTAHPRGAHTNHKILKSKSSLDTHPTSRLPTGQVDKFTYISQ